MTPSPTPTRSLRPALATAALFVLLVVGGIALLGLVPPGSTGPSGDASRPDIEARGANDGPGSAAFELVEPGDVARPVTGLSYRFDADDAQRFHIVLEQRMAAHEGSSDSNVVTRLEALVELQVSPDDGRKGNARVLEFDVSVEADDSAVELPAVSSLMQGILVEVELDPTLGIGADEPIAATNPQVKRMISMLVDALRQAHPRLPESGAAAVGARWVARSSWSQEDGSLSASVVGSHRLEVAAADDGVLPIATELELGLEGGSASGTGRGELVASFDASRGRLLESRGTVSFEQSILGASDEATAAARQTRTLQWTIRAAD